MNDPIPLSRDDFDRDSTIQIPQGSVEYDSSLEAYRLEHDWTTNNSLTVSVLSVVEVASEASMDDLPPLHDSIDPDGLDKLFAPLKSGVSRARGRVTFPYAGFRVTVTGDGQITVRQIYSEETTQ